MVHANRGGIAPPLPRPVVKVITNADGSSCEEEKEIDLVKALTLFIVDTL